MVNYPLHFHVYHTTVACNRCKSFLFNNSYGPIKNRFPSTFVFNNLPALNVENVFFSSRVQALPSALCANLYFHLDTQFCIFQKQGGLNLPGRKEGLRRRLHLAGWSIVECLNKTQILGRAHSVLKTVQPRPSLAPRGPRARGFLRVEAIRGQESRSQRGRLTQRHGAPPFQHPHCIP